MITNRRKFTTKIALYGMSSFHFTVGINLKSFPWPVHSVQETYSNSISRRHTRLHGMPQCHNDNDDDLSGRGLMTSLAEGNNGKLGHDPVSCYFIE